MKEKTGTRAPARSLRVLLVDDDPSFVAELTGHLQGRGFSVTSTWNADGALSLLVKEWYDAVILDNGLPGRMGIAVLPLIKERSRAPVILVSAHPNDDTARDARALGAMAFLAKPLDLAALERRLRQLAADSSGKDSIS